MYPGCREKSLILYSSDTWCFTIGPISRVAVARRAMKYSTDKRCKL